MKVCIAEKPSVAREIANVIGAKSRKDGYFEGNGYQVTWTFGHFCQLLPPQDYKGQWKRWDLNTLPMLPEKFDTKLMGDSGVKKQYRIIKSLFKKAAVVINCGDAGTEGELIQRWVIKETGYKGPVQRLWISSLTSQAIRKGFTDLQAGSKYDNLYYAASSRAIGDWLLGMNATRLYTLKYGGYKQVLSIGRVQTPTLAMLVQRHYEIQQFTPTAYWELHTVYRDTTFAAATGKYNNKEDGEAILTKVTGHDLHITDVQKKEGKEYAPKLFDLTSLQVYCNNRYGYTADRTLKLVQKLYEMKVVSYPRVDTTYLPNDVYPKVPSILKGMRKYERLTSSIQGQKLRKSGKVFNDKKVTDHHAIIPTGEEKQLTDEQAKVYDIIARRFIAVFYPDCKVSKTQVKANANGVDFVAKGKEILEEGWRVVLPKKKSDRSKANKENDAEKELPTFSMGEHGPHQPQLAEKTTKAPPYYTEATLLRAMETAGKQVDDNELRELMKENGIGRPSTRASIIETLFRRKYAYRRKKQVLPTDMGIELIGTIQNRLLKSAELTGQWEKKLKEIEQGRYNPKVFIGEMKAMVDNLVTEVRMETSVKRLSKASPTKVKMRSSKKPSRSTSKNQGTPCPKCTNGTLLKGKTSHGCSKYKDGCDMRIPFTFMGKKISDTQVKRLVTKGETTKLKGWNVAGAKTTGYAVLTADFTLQFRPMETAASKKVAVKKATMPNCPKCKKGKLIKGNTAYGCSQWKSGCDYKFSFTDVKTKAAGRKMTRELVLSIISNGYK